MSVLTLKVQKRESGKKAVKQLRHGGYVPGVFYYKNDSIPIYSDPHSLRPIVYTSATRIINLEIEGIAARDCVLKEVTFDPVSEKIQHFDLMGIASEHKVHVEVPIVLKGQPEGIRQGGILQQVVRKVMIRALPKDLPEHIEIEIGHLTIGHHAVLSDAKTENVEFEIPLDSVICSVIPPRVAEEAKPAAEALAAAAEGESKPEEEKEKGKGKEK